MRFLSPSPRCWLLLNRQYRNESRFRRSEEASVKKGGMKHPSGTTDSIPAQLRSPTHPHNRTRTKGLSELERKKVFPARPTAKLLTILT
ncbi:hypothetical protein CDAR_387951 [Caerostris darwini]|uniref:Uncharacterized protein n=1 Tax=Caerostris darwini TaxID=1538125 RepID=A0AAV4SVT1_9ARAC|nr:hypothetical protein CDAR_387951 [Caerostris darwini]